MHFEAKTEIQCAPETVWSALTNATTLVKIGSGITKLEGNIEPNQKIKLWSEASPNRAFALRVAEFEPGKRMVWSGGMPLGLFTGTRVFSVEQNGNKTVLHVREDYTGPLAGMIGKSIPDLNPSFQKFVGAIKTHCETPAG